MATNIYDIHKFIDLLCNKEQIAYFSPEEKDQYLFRASNWCYSDYWGIYATSQDAQDALAPFKASYNFTNGTSPLGLITLPSDYEHFLGGWAQSYDNANQRILYYGFDVVNDDELAERLMSQLRPITTTKPIGQWVGKGKIQLWPKLANAGYISYLKSPVSPKLDYTLSGVDGRDFTYNSGASTQLEWSETYLNKVVFKAIQFIGLNIDEDTFVKYGMGVNKEI